MADEIIKKQITKEGFDELQNELSERKTGKRSEIARRIEDAKAQGDLSENSEYDEARAEQAENETRIEELEAILKSVEVVDDSKRIGRKIVNLYYGTSTYSVDEAKTLIDWLINEAEGLNIPVPVGKERNDLYHEWGLC